MTELTSHPLKLEVGVVPTLLVACKGGDQVLSAADVEATRLQHAADTVWLPDGTPHTSAAAWSEPSLCATVAEWVSRAV